MTVYIDVFFLINFIMDFLILITAAKLSKEKAGLVRIIAAALLGAIYSCLVIVLKFGNGIMEIILTYIVISTLMAFIVYGYKGLTVLFENVLIIFVVTFILSGIVNALYYKAFIKSNAGLMAAGISATVVIIVISGVLEKRRRNRTDFVTVRIVKGENHIDVKALVDTGNSLVEPITRKPASVISKNIVEKLKKGDDGIFLIPYKSVGMEHGMLKGFMADYMVIIKENDKKILIKKPILAEYAGSFTDSESYQMLLNPQITEQGEGYDYKNENSKQNVF